MKRVFLVIIVLFLGVEILSPQNTTTCATSVDTKDEALIVTQLYVGRSIDCPAVKISYFDSICEELCVVLFENYDDTIVGAFACDVFYDTVNIALGQPIAIQDVRNVMIIRCNKDISHIEKACIARDLAAKVRELSFWFNNPSHRPVRLFQKMQWAFPFKVFPIDSDTTAIEHKIAVQK